ncbi:hypothetical protein vseg_008527 [Gypsophila vaccaria]
MDDSSTNTMNSPKLDELNSSLIIKLKVPKLEPDPSNNNNNNNHHHHMLVRSADVEDDLEEGEIKDDAVIISPPSPPQQQQHAPAAAAVVNLRICPFCNKTFSNGKALGGHMRIHAEKKKMVLAGPPGPSPNPNPSPESGGGSGVFKCELCPKEFPSRKSLFGHMRSHPDRFWRGMNRPPSSYAPETSSAAEERLRSLGNWRVTGKRGRVGAASPVTSSSSTSSFGPHAEAAADLMLLLNGKTEYEDEDEEDEDEDEDEDEKLEDEEELEKARKKGKGLMYDDVHTHKCFDEDEIYYLKNLGFLPNFNFNHDYRGIKINDDVTTINNSDNEDDFSVKVSPLSTPLKIIKEVNNKKVNIGKIISENNSNNNNNNNNNNKWVCNTCGKSFPTHQALGGHRSSHNKDKYNNNNNNVNININNNGTVVVQTRIVDGSGLTDVGPSSGNSGGGDEGQNEVVVNGGASDDVAVAAVGNGVHKCKICDKTFASGQALGGHQRCHYVVPFADVFVSSEQTCQMSRKGLFDLNVEPPMGEDDDDGDGDGDGDDGGDVTFDSSSISKYYCSY